MHSWLLSMKRAVAGLAILALGALTACVETTYTSVDGQVTATTSEAAPVYRMVMT